MNFVKRVGYLEILIILCWFFGGLALRNHMDFIAGFGGLVGLLLVRKARTQKKLRFPEGFAWYAVFILVFWLSLLWSRDHGLSSRHLVVYCGGALFWLGLFNFRDKLKISVESILIAVGLLFLAVFCLQKFFDYTFTNIGFSSLVYQASMFKNHNHLGDFVVLMLIVALDRFLNKSSIISFFSLFIGSLVLMTSLSRSSLVGFAVGAGYLFSQRGWFERYRWLGNSVLLVTAFLFLLISTQKSLLLSRPYFVQAVAGIVDHPFGVGVGSFGVISDNPKYHLLGLSGYSTVVHNLILEMLVGLGVFGLSFVVWLVKVLKSVVVSGVRSRSRFILPGALFLALLANFLFDTTYFIPTMVWVWFALMGVAQQREEKSTAFHRIFVWYLVFLILSVNFVVVVRGVL